MSLSWVPLPRRSGNKSFGKAGEDMAAAFLEQKGYKVLARNFHCRRGEADIIAGSGETIVIVEVKSRRSVDYAYPEEAVDRIKRKRLIAISEIFLEKNGMTQRDVRFDVIAALYDSAYRRWDIRHIEDAFGEV